MILFTGRGTSGSWKIRGEQLGRALGAKVKPRATLKDCQKADLIVLVKRPSPGLMDAIKQSGTPWIWDFVDAYPQPECTGWVRSKAISWVKGQIARHGPDAVIWPNQKMADDCGTKRKDTVIYHHHRVDMPINPIREEIKVVGYEGSPKYLGKWAGHLLRECEKRGWGLVINQGCHADFDICVAFRDDAFNGYCQHSWKSNVKLSNCHGSGTPFIGPSEHGYIETAAGGEQWVEYPENLRLAFDALESHEMRQDIHKSFLQRAYSVDDAASDLKAFLSTI